MLSFIYALVMSFAFAGTTAGKDWKLVKELDPLLQTQVCRISTKVSNLSTPVELSLSFPIAFEKPPTLSLRTAAGALVTKAVIPLSKKESETLFLLQQNPDADVFWYAPLNLDRLVNFIAESNALPIQLLVNGVVVSGKISLAGSTAAINAAAECLKSKDILVLKFLEELNTVAGDAVLGQNQTPQQLYAYVEQAYTFYTETLRQNAELVKVRAAIKPLATQEKDAALVLSKAQAALDKASTAANQTRNKISNAETRLAAIPGEILDLQNKKPEADSTLSAKAAIYQPLRLEVDKIQAEINTARANVSQADRAIAERRRIIRDGESSIDSYRSEAGRLSDDNSRIDREIDPLERRAGDLRIELSRYSIEDERREYLARDSGYQRDLRDLQNYRQQAQAKQSERQNANSDLQGAESRLQTCRMVDKADCTVQQAEVDRARSVLQNIDNQLNDINNQIRRCQREIRQAEQNAQWAAERGRQDIVDRLANVERDIKDLDDRRRQNYARINAIYQDYIPSLEFDIRKARNEIPGWETRRREANVNLANATQRLETFKAANNYAVVESEYIAAKAVVDGIVKGISDRQAEEKKHNADLKTLRPLLVKQDQEVVKLTTPRDQAQAKLSSIQDKLKPLRAREEEIVSTVAGIKPQYDEIRKLYQTLFKKLLQP